MVGFAQDIVRDDQHGQFGNMLAFCGSIVILSLGLHRFDTALKVPFFKVGIYTSVRSSLRSSSTHPEGRFCVSVLAFRLRSDLFEAGGGQASARQDQCSA